MCFIGTWQPFEQRNNKLAELQRALFVKYVLPVMGVLHIAMCHAIATREELWASPACTLPMTKTR